MDLLARVRRTIREHDLARPATRVAVAVSGGSDSIALAHIFRELAAAGELRAAGVIHFNHQLRAGADRDEAFVARLAENFGWPFLAGRGDVAALARHDRCSIENAARTARHDFFARAREQLGADVVALGHTRDDQAETFLLRLVRGAGPCGLAAMHPRHGFVVRPLIDCRRGELRAYLDERKLPFTTDESNDDVSIPRNRVRAELIPLLENRFNPGVVDVLADAAELARHEWAWMEQAAHDVEAGCAEIGQTAESAAFERVPGARASRRSQISLHALRDAPVALRRLVIWRAMNAAAAGRSVGFEHVSAVLRLLDSERTSGSVDAPGHRVQRIGDRLVLTTEAAGRRRAAAGTANVFHYPLSIPGEVRVAEAGYVLSAEPAPAGVRLDAPVSAGDPAVAVVRSDVCPGPLAVRNRRPGDRFRPPGLGGRKKLQDFFVDRKVARHHRDAVPIVVDDRDRIVWVAGYAIDDQFRVTDPTQAVLILRLKPVGGCA